MAGFASSDPTASPIWTLTNRGRLMDNKSAIKGTAESFLWLLLLKSPCKNDARACDDLVMVMDRPILYWMFFGDNFVLQPKPGTQAKL